MSLDLSADVVPSRLWQPEADSLRPEEERPHESPELDGARLHTEETWTQTHTLEKYTRLFVLLHLLQKVQTKPAYKTALKERSTLGTDHSERKIVTYSPPRGFEEHGLHRSFVVYGKRSWLFGSRNTTAFISQKPKRGLINISVDAVTRRRPEASWRLGSLLYINASGQVGGNTMGPVRHHNFKLLETRLYVYKAVTNYFLFDDR
ncbi:hypothetical protein Q8A73_011425 [Channa argus]|nr:hypothetical protein Q8A73_011425 [Channa argus]